MTWRGFAIACALVFSLGTIQLDAASVGRYLSKNAPKNSKPFRKPPKTMFSPSAKRGFSRRRRRARPKV